MSECLIDGCGRPVRDAGVCATCARACDVALGEVSWLLHQLDLVITRQTARAEHVGGHAAQQPLAFSWEGSEQRWALVNTVTTWARVVADEKPARLPDTDSVGILAAWLTGHVEWLRHHPDGHEAIDELTACIRRAQQVIDVRPDRIYAGPCGVTGEKPVGPICAACSHASCKAIHPCGQDLYADPMSAVVTCHACGQRYDVAQRKAWLMEAARDYLASASEASALCYKMLGDLVTTAMIRGYVRRGKLASHAARLEHGREVALYRIGDVIDAARAARWDEREQRATRKAGAA